MILPDLDTPLETFGVTKELVEAYKKTSLSWRALGIFIRDNNPELPARYIIYFARKAFEDFQ